MKIAAAFLLFAIVSAPASAATAPRITSIANLADLPTPLPFPYDASADANRDVDAALARAKSEHKLALIDLGGNWCGDCRVLAGLMQLPEMKAFIDAHYVVVGVDVGRFNKNLQIPDRWNATKDMKSSGVPALLIVDPETNKLVDAGRIAALEDARHMTPQAIADWLAQWVK